MTKEQFRAELKTAFLEGWRAARMGTSAVAWENSIIRTNVDYAGAFERLESPPSINAVDPADGVVTDGPRAPEDLSSTSKSTFGVG